MPPILTGFTPTTELEAINAMLLIIGEQPLDDSTDLDTTTQTDVASARTFLRNVTREALTIGWRFNTDLSFEIKPSATYSWVDTAGVTTLLNVFTPPADLVRFTTSEVLTQVGTRAVDVVTRKSKKYAPGTTIFYDRLSNREGFDQSMYPFLYLDATWFVDFDDTPEVFRRYVVAVASRQFVSYVVGAGQLTNFTLPDEAKALRNLYDEEGLIERFTFISPGETAAVRGMRPSNLRTFSTRTNRGSV